LSGRALFLPTGGFVMDRYMPVTGIDYSIAALLIDIEAPT